MSASTALRRRCDRSARINAGSLEHVKAMKKTAASLAVAALLMAATASAQAPQTVRLRGVIEKVDGNTVMAKSDKGDELKLNLADKMLVVDVVKASMADIKPG